MKITIENYDQTHIVNINKDDVTFDEYIELLRSISLSVGYSYDAIVEVFDK